MADLNSTIVRGKLRVTEDINANGNIAGSSITGNGSGLTNLNASNIGSGTLSADRLATSGATAGSYGPSANATPAYGATFNVPYITVDNKGRVTKAETKTVKIPASDNIDTHYTNYLQIKGNGTEAVKFEQNANKTLNLKPSGSVSISAVSGEITISATDTNTSHNHSAGVGLVGSGSAGTGGGTYTYKAKLRSETALTVDSAAATTTSGRVYPVAADKSGYLSVNVPWTDADTKNTAGATNHAGKLYLIGAEEQTDNPKTYSKSSLYVDEAGILTANIMNTGTIKANNRELHIYGYNHDIATFSSSSDGETKESLNGHLIIYGNDDSSNQIKPARSDNGYYKDVDTYYFNTGLTLHCLLDSSTGQIDYKDYKLSFPCKSGTLATLDDAKIEIVDLTGK